MRIYIQRQRLAECPPELLIHPDIPRGVTTFRGFARVREIAEAGARAAELAMPELREQLDRRLWIDWPPHRRKGIEAPTP
jgi:predicted acylesterase/phospholipase RssA